MIESLSAKGLFVEPQPKRILRKAKWLTSNLTAPVVEGAGEFHKGAKLANAVLAVLVNWLKPDGGQIRRIRERLPESRVVVIVDDLDRCAQSVLPSFLLSLREILDFPKFTFLLAFDDDIVADTIRQVNPAWGSGHDFLDKILDFRFSLPPILLSNKLTLLKRALNDFAPFCPLASFCEVEDLLPDNPRKLKALVRSISSLEPILARHNDGEFDWTDVWLMVLLRQESHILLEKLCDEKTFNETLGVLHRLYQNPPSAYGNSSDTPDKAESLLDSLNLPNPETRERLQVLFNAIRGRSSLRCQYVFGFAVQAPAVTWKEFYAIVSAWETKGTAEGLEEILRSHSAKRQDSQERVTEEFIQAISLRMDEILTEAVHTNDVENSRGVYGGLQPLLRLMQSFFSIPGTLTASRFKIFYDKAQYWSGAHRDGAEAEVRQAERSVLLDVAKQISAKDSADFLEMLQPWSEPLSHGESDAVMNRRLSLRKDISDFLLPLAYKQLLTFLSDSDSLKKILEKNRHTTYKQLLFNRTMLPWPQELSTKMMDMFTAASFDKADYDKVRSLALVFCRSWTYREPEIDREGVALLLQNNRIVSSMWQALQMRQLLLRGDLELLAIRARFVEAGASKEAMTLNDRLELSTPTFEKNREQIMGSLQ